MAEAPVVPWLIRVLRLSLVSICCSTWLYITSCWVKALESIGLVGSWFLSWVVSRVRKVEKLPDSCFIASGVLLLLLLGVVLGGEETGATMLDPDVETAISGAAIGGAGGGGFDAGGGGKGKAAAAAAAEAGAGAAILGGLLAQREIEAVL